MSTPNEGIHSLRLGPYAIVDVAATVVGAGILAYFAGAVWFVPILFSLVLLGVVVHWALGIDTALNKQLGI